MQGTEFFNDVNINQTVTNMRCKNCGWENPEGSLRCAKCNAPLMGSMVEGARPSSDSQESTHDMPLRGTVKESDVFGSFSTPPQPRVGLVDEGFAESHAPASCPRCNYPVRPDMNVCPSCGAPLKGGSHVEIKKEPERSCPKCGHPIRANEKFCSNCGAPLKMGTVNNWISPDQGVFCTLKPIAWTNEGVDYQPVTYSGDVIVLNRANTDANNNSITSQEQAVLTHEGDAWFIENKSEQETTFLKVSKKTKLENGDVIILGNRMFEFKG